MVRMSDIARRCGISRATVSAVLNDHHEKLGIKSETAEKVRATAEKMGYFRNEMAVAIKTGQNAVIGCITIGLSSEWIARSVTGLLQTGQDEGYLIKIVNLETSDNVLDALRRLVRQRMAGIFCCNVNVNATVGRAFRELCGRYEMPVVGGNCSESIGGGHFRSDDLQGMELAVGHLWKLGHRQIAHLTGDAESMTGPLRRDGFLQAMQRRGASVPTSWVVTGSYDPQIAEASAERLLRRSKNLPTAILCANDEVAVVTLRAARRLGLRVPQDLSVVGYSDMKSAQLADPPLTTIRQPFEKMGARGATVLLELIRKQAKKTPDVEWLPTKLVVRASTAAYTSSK